MDKGDGLNIAHFWRDDSDSEFDNSAQLELYSDSSVENSPFRGFEKDPKVLIEKLNIEPFLANINKDSRRLRPRSLNGTLGILPQLESNCVVKLVREDLIQLKKDILENSRRNKSKSNGILMMPFLHCKICEKAYNSEKKLQNHLENKHMLVYRPGLSRKPQKRVSFSDHVIVHELKEYHKCRKCTKIFEEYQSLKAHMKLQHRKRKCYICHYCSKNFVDRMFFKVHIKLHCDVCGLLLPNKRKYVMHRRDSCRVVKKYACKTCQNLFFSYMDLKDHSYDHLEDLFVCDICKDQHISKCAISHHIAFLHSKKRPKELYSSRNLGSERLYLCNFCDVSSIDKEVIDRHVSVLPDLNNRKRTGYKDYYFCDQCLRKFDTETSMLQHKWSHFLNTSQNPQVQRKSKGAPKLKRNGLRRIFKVNEKLPNLMQPKIVLERLNFKIQNSIVLDSNNFNNSEEISIDPRMENLEGDPDSRNENTLENKVIEQIIVGTKSEKDENLTVKNGIKDLTSPEEVASEEEEGTHTEIGVVVKKAIVDPKSKKTLISRFQCEKCHKYYSTNYCLNRHMLAVHEDLTNLRCNMCEETFVWPSLLRSHNCLRMNIPERPFEDARPDIQLDSYRDLSQAGFDDLMNISESEDYMNSVDFEIPAPIVEYQNRGNPARQYIPVSNYKIVMQEVPIEF